MFNYVAALFIGLTLVSTNLWANDTSADTTGIKAPDTLSFLPVLGSLTFVIGAILILAYIVRKMNLGIAAGKAIKVITALSLGTKERVVVIEVNGKQHLLGVTPSQVNHLFELDEPINTSAKPTDSDSHDENSPLTFQKILQGLKDKRAPEK